MADPEHVEILRQGVEAWNNWRNSNPYLRPDLREINLQGVDINGAYLAEADLSRVDFSGRDLSGALLHEADFTGAKFNGTNLRKAKLGRSILFRADLIKANLEGAELQAADFRQAHLMGANLKKIYLGGVEFTAAALSRADFTGSILNATVFGENYLDDVIGLDSVIHNGPSIIGIETIYLSKGNIPEAFLRGCGVPESFIVQIPALVTAIRPVQFYSCFISYSGKDEEFARRLHSRMRQANLRVWFAPEDMKGGDKLYDQINRAIQVHDRLLLVLSESSMQSKWVETEIRRARKVELKEKRRKLFPIRLVSYEALQEWVCIDSATGEDLAEEVRSYFIPDFSNWKNQDDFEATFSNLLSDLKASV
jgi:uncharacterized protein YjbI with pentapeptide repeats